MTRPTTVHSAATHSGRPLWIAAFVLLTAWGNAHAVVNLADQPLATSATVPGNLLLALSVEYPTAISASYKASSTPYVTANTYLGYFDPNKCYKYLYDTTTPANSYFEPNLIAVTHTCVTTSSLPLWSGNWLNWATMQTIDSFRSALTGGYRVTDTTSATILEKAWGSNQGSASQNAPDKRIPASGSSATIVAGATPFNFSSVTSSIFSLGNKIRVTSTGSTTTNSPVAYTTQNSKILLSASASAVYELVVRVQVCKTSPGLESNCTQYGSNYKPEGLMQQYATKIRYGAFGYLNDANISRDGGVLRAGMKFVGPIKAVPGQPSVANSATEWSSADGTFIVNPDTADASASSVTNSGVMNYLNKFGQAAGTYKIYDPIGEMYYGAIRYFKNQGNVAAYSSLGTNTTNAAIYKDGFPVITSWVDPILYSCQKNFILGIGDTNTHRDANLPGSTIRGNEPAMPTEVAADTSINVKNATDMIGKIEGVSGLGSANPSWCCNQNTFFMGGLAYDAHTADMRPNDFKNPDGSKTNIQTVTTFWLDVLESGYSNRNQFYYATKYGGFKAPTGFLPYGTNNALKTLAVGTSTTALVDTMWHNNSDTYGTDKRPDNYYDASAADKMVAGLTTAFSNIASQLQEATTAFSATSARVNTSGNTSFQSKYDAATWSGDVIGNSAVFDAAGNPTYTVAWNAKTVLDAQSSRKIVTCCTSSGSSYGLPFLDANMSAGGLINRTNYATFAAVPGVAAGSQSAANYLNYLRGDRSKELSQTNGIYRTRSYLLGDIVNSKIAAVGPPESILNESTNTGYAAYRTAYATRKTVAYVGANDGMLHAFDGSLTTGGGTELFAYIPSFSYGTTTSGPVSGLASLGAPDFTHHYLVDQTPAVYDIDLAKTGGTTNATPKWRSVLIGGMGKGGQGYFAIDVTDPTTWTSETAVASKVLWEFTDSAMGYSYGDASVIKTKKYGWVVVLTSGYNNADGIGYFFIVNPANGSLLEKVSTNFGSVANQSGLTFASAYTPDFTDGTADSVYAGDLYGNVWRLDLTASSGSYQTPTRIAELRDPSGNPQPVTTRPLIEIQPNTQKRYVVIGTGRLLDNSDIANTQTETIYAIGDGAIDTFYTSATLPTGKTFPVHRADLNANTNLLNGIGSAPANPLGWYYDLSLLSNGAAERINVNPTVNYGMVAVAANLPNGDACNPSGTNRIFGFNLGTGQSVLTDNSGTQIAFSTKLAGVVTDLGFANLNGKIKLLAGNNQLTVNNIEGPGNVSSSIKKLNWRELPTAD